MVLDGNAVRSVDRAAALLLALGESQGEAGVTELARRLGLHKSTASRLLATLQKRGLVEQDDETGKYRLGLVVIRLAERAERTLDLRRIALPELERLARLTHETTGLGILEGDTLLAVAQVDGPNLIAVGDWTGRATPLHCVAGARLATWAVVVLAVLSLSHACDGGSLAGPSPPRPLCGGVGAEHADPLRLRPQRLQRLGHRRVVLAALDVDEEHVAAEALLARARLDPRQVHAAEGELRQAADQPARAPPRRRPRRRPTSSTGRDRRAALRRSRASHDEAGLVLGLVVDAARRTAQP